MEINLNLFFSSSPFPEILLKFIFPTINLDKTFFSNLIFSISPLKK